MPRHQITYEMVDEHNVAEIDEMGWHFVLHKFSSWVCRWWYIHDVGVLHITFIFKFLLNRLCGSAGHQFTMYHSSCAITWNVVYNFLSWDGLLVVLSMFSSNCLAGSKVRSHHMYMSMISNLASAIWQGTKFPSMAWQVIELGIYYVSYSSKSL